MNDMEKKPIDENELQAEYNRQLSARPVFRVFAWIGLAIIIGMVILTFIAGVTGSEYFLGCLVLSILVSILVYVILWIGKLLYRSHNK